MLLSASSAAPRAAARPNALAAFGHRALFLGLLASTPFLGYIGNSVWITPAVRHAWVLVPFAALFMLPFLDVRRPLRVAHFDLLALLSFLFALGLWSNRSAWPMTFIYLPLGYLAVRMAIVAGVGRAHSKRSTGATAARPALSPTLGARWLTLGAVVLVVVHVVWTLGSPVFPDEGEAGLYGARAILHGRRVYGANRALDANLGFDPHLDTYGPTVYDAFVPFAGLASLDGGENAARLATLAFDLLTAFLLFVLGRQVRGPTAGVTLAYAWLAFPFTLYIDEIGSNDCLLTATLLLALLASRWPARRGAAIALAAWTKLSPLALIPAMLGHDAWRAPRHRNILLFASGFILASAVLFVPALAGGGASEFVSRTFGAQLSRPPADSIWEVVEHANIVLRMIGDVAHGLLVALAGAFALVLLWTPRRRDLVGLAAACVPVLIALEICDGYFAFDYLIWFVPFTLVAVLLDGEPNAPSRAPRILARRRPAMLASA